MKTLIASLIVFSSVAGATNKPPQKPSEPSVTSSSSAKAGAASKSTSSAKQSQSQEQSANAVNEGNSLAVNQDYVQVRQAPSIAQGSIIPPACGAGGNAGGSNSHGAGFLGFSWVTADCHRYITAQNYLALGMPTFACEILNTTKTSKRVTQELGIQLPDCKFAEKVETVKADPPVVVVPVSDPTVDEKIKRAFETSQRK